MKRKLLLTLIVIVLLIPAALAFTQEQTASPKIEITGVNATDLPTVLITANVTDSLGQPVAGLTAENFILSGELADKGQIVSVENITDNNLSFAAVLVIDTSSSMAGTPFAKAKDAAKTFINAIGPNDPVAIITFDTQERLVLDFTTDKTLLLTTIDQLRFGGKTTLYDGALLGVKTAAAAPLPRRAVILLSDGAEFGGLSSAARGDALNEARLRGVPVYTIGLGFGTDRTYLQALSAGTNARNYESPSSDQLVEIYRGLAGLLRSQYVITVAANVAADGSVYNSTLQAITPEGATNEIVAQIRAPIPVPIVTFPNAPTEPIREVTRITADVSADDTLANLEFTIDGQPAASELFTVTIDPVTLAPGPHTLPSL